MDRRRNATKGQAPPNVGHWSRCACFTTLPTDTRYEFQVTEIITESSQNEPGKELYIGLPQEYALWLSETPALIRPVHLTC